MIPSPPAHRKRRCLIIYTGGTIGMVSSADGSLVPSSSSLASLLASFPETQHADVPHFDVHVWPVLYDSSDIGPRQWALLADEIYTHYYSYDGFVVLHGTDTMSYTASALSFMLENLGKPVVLTGSMIPLSAPVSDAKRNLLISMIVSCALDDIPEVCVCFNDSLFRGNRSNKCNPSSTTAAFHSSNMRALATMGVAVNVNSELILNAPKRPLRVFTDMRCEQVICLTYTPGMNCKLLTAMFAHSSKQAPLAVILSLFGAGNAPAAVATTAAVTATAAAGAVTAPASASTAYTINIDNSLISVLRDGIRDHDIEVVVMSQCSSGSVDMRQYAAGVQMLKLNVINAFDMTLECCSTKLAYLLGKGLRKQQLRTAMQSSLRGELTRSSAQEYKDYSNYYDSDSIIVSNNNINSNIALTVADLRAASKL